MRTTRVPLILAALLTASPLAAQQPRTVAIGQSVSAELTATDPIGRSRRSPYHVWTLEGRRGQRIVIDVMSPQFDAYVSLRDDAGLLLGSDDDSGEDMNARLRTVLPRDGQYRIIITAFADSTRGRYTLAITGWEAPNARSAGTVVDIRAGETRDGVLEPGDDIADGPYQDRWMLVVQNQWSLRPVGEQVELADFPINVAVPASGRFAAILHSGYSQHQILCVELPSRQVVSRTRVAEAFYGLEFSRDGKQLFCSGAGDEVIHWFDFESGKLSDERQVRLRDAKQRGIPAGLATEDGRRILWVANVAGHVLSKVDLSCDPPAVADFALGTNTTALISAPVTPTADFDTAAVEKRAEALLYATSPEEPFPYACRVEERRQRVYVSLWSRPLVTDSSGWLRSSP